MAARSALLRSFSRKKLTLSQMKPMSSAPINAEPWPI
jgi:hypothetical protein